MALIPGTPTADAIDAGVDDVLPGAPSGSEARARIDEIVLGLKEGVPLASPILGLAPLSEVEAIAAGAAHAASTVSPSSAMDADERDALRALARGYMRGAFDELAATPQAGRAALDEAVAAGVFAGGIDAILAAQTPLPPADVEAYGDALAGALFAALDEQGAAVSTLLGAPGYADLTTLAAALVGGQMGELPQRLPRDEIDALATFGAGAIDGMIAGLVTSFPQGVPAPSEAQLRAWFEGIASHEEGTAPWDRHALDLLFAYAPGLGETATHTVEDARAYADAETPPPVLAQLSAWGKGLANGGYQHLRDASPEARAEEAEAYASALAGPGIELLLGAEGGNADLDLIAGWGAALGAGLADLVGSSAASLGLTEAYLGGLTTAIASFPPDAGPGQTAVVTGFASGVTQHIVSRLEPLAAIMGPNDIPVVAGFAEGLAVGAVEIAGGPALEDPSLAGAIGDGLAAGFLTTNPSALVGHGGDFVEAVHAWSAANPPASVSAVNAFLQDMVADPYDAVQAYANGAGAAPAAWAGGKGVMEITSGELLWLDEFAWTSAFATMDAIGQDPGITPEELDRSATVIGAYAADVTGSALSLDVASAIGALDPAAIDAHARRTASFLLTPLDWVAGEPGAASAFLNASLDNAGAFARFTDVAYASGAIASADAMARGIVDAPPSPSHDPRTALDAWVGGMVEAILATPQLDGDLQARLTWLELMTSSVVPATTTLTEDQSDAVHAFAAELGAWALGSEEHVPDLAGSEQPLLTWANATISGALPYLPEVMTEEEQSAVAAYLVGIQTAITGFPTPDVAAWSVTDLAAISAYLGGISSGVALVAEDTHLFACAYGFETVRPCPEDEEEEEEEEEEPPCETDCETEPPCDEACQLERYLTNLQAWGNGLASGAIDDAPSAEPTEQGIALVTVWATSVLAGHGFCPGQEGAECGEGARGPLPAFVAARERDVSAYAKTLGDAYLSFVDHEDPTQPGLTGGVPGPLLTWLTGIDQGMAQAYLAPLDHIPQGAGAPGSPFPPPPAPEDERYLTALALWSTAMFEAGMRAVSEGFVPDRPDTAAVNVTAETIDRAIAEVVFRGGADAILDSAEVAIAYAEGAAPDQALEELALGLLVGSKAQVVDPATHDVDEVYLWYRGLAEGGVAAISEGGELVSNEQLTAIRTYAEVMAGAIEPGPPLPGAVAELLAPPPEEPEGGGSGGGDPEPDPEPTPPAPEEIYLSNLQAHAEGIGRAVMDAPARLDDVESYALALQAYMDAVVAAGSRVPLSADAGFPARLSTWVAAEAAGALAASPPTSAERLTPNPPLVQQAIEDLTTTSPWNLAPGSDEAAAWATAAIVALSQIECSADEATCEQIGATLGQALGQGLPLEDAPTIDHDAQVETLKAVLQATVDALGAEELPLAPRASAIAQGILAAGVPEGAGKEEAYDIYYAVALEAIGIHDEVDAQIVQLYTGEVARWLLSHPADHESTATRLARIVESAAASGDAQDALQAIQIALGQSGPQAAPSSSSTITVTDGVRTLNAGALDGDARLDGLRDIVITSYASGPAAQHDDHEIVWRFGGDEERTAPMQGSDGIHTATIPAAQLASAARGETFEFTIRQTGAGSEKTIDADGAAFAFVPDRDAPVAAISPPPAPAGSSLRLAWSGTDGDGAVVGYRVQVREGQGEWRDWIASTADTSASFSGQPGVAYAFRAIATDAVGHAGAPSAEATVTIPAGAPPNRAPTLAIRAPTATSVMGASIPVALDASDPDGTPVTVRICLQRAESAIDLACPHEGSALQTTLDATGLADGRYQIHATATDGTRTAEATSAVFTVDRAPPAIRGALADATASRVLVSASVDADARSVTVQALGKDVGLTDDGRGADARGGDGVWTAATTLPPGEHTILFRAVDALGNAATLARTVVVPAPPPPAEETPAPGPTPPSTTPTAPTGPASPADADEKGAPAPGALLLVAALGLVALLRRRRV